VDDSGCFLPGMLAPPIPGLQHILAHAEWPAFRREVLNAQARTVHALLGGAVSPAVQPQAPQPGAGPSMPPAAAGAHAQLAAALGSVAHSRPFAARLTGPPLAQLTAALAEWRGRLPHQRGVSVAAEWALRAQPGSSSGQCSPCYKQFMAFKPLPERLEALVAAGHGKGAVLAAVRASWPQMATRMCMPAVLASHVPSIREVAPVEYGRSDTPLGAVS
jgi:hypothetical protein